MSDDSKPPYGQYQLDIYFNSVLNDTKVPFTTDPNKLEDAARKAMTPEGFGYVFGGAGEQSTMHANRLAFRQWKLIPRYLRPTIPRDLRIELFGKTYGMFVFLSSSFIYSPNIGRGIS